jgi:hypothetical protein
MDHRFLIEMARTRRSEDRSRAARYRLGREARGAAEVARGGIPTWQRITSAQTANGETTIRGRVAGTPQRAFAVRFFSNPPGESVKRFIGEKSITTGSDGFASFSFTPAIAVAVKDWITAIATDGVTGDASAPWEPFAVAAG